MIINDVPKSSDFSRVSINNTINTTRENIVLLYLFIIIFYFSAISGIFRVTLSSISILFLRQQQSNHNDNNSNNNCSNSALGRRTQTIR